MKLKKGDEVAIIRGKDAGKNGKIEKVLPQLQRVIVHGVNQYKRHMKATQNRKSEIITLTKPIAVANVLFLCPKCKQKARIGFTLKNKEKVRICKKCQEQI